MWRIGLGGGAVWLVCSVILHGQSVYNEGQMAPCKLRVFSGLVTVKPYQEGIPHARQVFLHAIQRHVLGISTNALGNESHG